MVQQPIIFAGNGVQEASLEVVQAWVKVMMNSDGTQKIEQILWPSMVVGNTFGHQVGSVSQQTAIMMPPPPGKLTLSPPATMSPPPGNLGLSSQCLANRKAQGAAACAALMAQIEKGGPESNAAFASLVGTVKTLSFDKQGCRLVQKAIESAAIDVAVSLAHEMKGCIREAAKDPNANFVLQRIIEVLPAASTKFIVEELLESVMEVAQHRAGCRVICRVIEHSPVDATAVELFNRVIKGSVVLSRHLFGHFVVQSLLEHGTAEQRHRIVGAFQGVLLQESQNRSSKYVVESLFQFCSPEDKQTMLHEIIDDHDALMKLVNDENGYYVSRAISQAFGDDPHTVAMISQFQKSAVCKGRRKSPSSRHSSMVSDEAKTASW